MLLFPFGNICVFTVFLGDKIFPIGNIILHFSPNCLYRVLPTLLKTSIFVWNWAEKSDYRSLKVPFFGWMEPVYCILNDTTDKAMTFIPSVFIRKISARCQHCFQKLNTNVMVGRLLQIAPSSSGVTPCNRLWIWLYW